MIWDRMKALFAEQPSPMPTQQVGRAIDWFANWNPDEGYAPQYLDDLLKEKGIGVLREMPRRCETVASGLRLLKFATLSNEVNVTPKGTDPQDILAAALVKHTIDTLEGTSVLRVLEDSEESFEMGFSAQVMDWAEPEIWQGRRIQRIASLRPLPQETVAFDVDEFGRIRPDGVWQSKSRQTVLPGYHRGAFDQIDRDRCIIWAFQKRSGHPYGESLLRPVWRWYKAKETILQALLRYLEFFGLPIVELSMQGKPNYSEMSAVLARIKRMMGGQTFVSHEGQKFTLHEVTHTSTNAHLDAMARFDRAISRALLSPALLMEGGESVGSNALGQAHKGTFTWFVDFIRRTLEREVLRDQFARPLVRHNLGPNVPPPDIYFDEFEPRDLALIITLLQAAKELGVTYSRSFARTMLGIEAPDDDTAPEELIGAEPEPEPDDVEVPVLDDEEVAQLSEGMRDLYFDLQTAAETKAGADPFYETFDRAGKNGALK